ncbi:MAG: hypothetical protein ACPGVB_02235 [Chitinophagales bacterium]
MKKYYLKGILAMLLCIGWQSSFAQVSGISYTLSPTVENVWWDDQAGLEDGLLFGGKFGLGFGEYLELRANYMQSGNLQTDFSNYGLADFPDSLFTPRDVKITRWGGDLKANLSKGALLPFVTFGTGVQSIELDTMEATKQIYAQVGAGVKFSLGDRSTLMIEAKNTRYNYNTVRNLLTEEDRADLGVIEDDLEVKELRNWSLAASVQIYLGGRRPGTLSELDKAYFRTFTDGLQGVRTPIEPTIAKVQFHQDLGFRNTWMLGGSAGFNFNPYLGIRGFYLQGINEGPISTDFDKLSMYGGELRMNLNAPGSGITPYLIAGGGNISVGDKYVPRRDSMAVENQAFAMAGAGITLPFSNRLKVFGNVRALITSNTEIADLQQTDDLQESWMTSFGVNLTLGKKAKTGNAFQLDMAAASSAEQKIANDLEKQALKEQYESQVLDLETKLNEAYAEKDIEKAAALMKEKEFAEQVVQEMEKQQVEQLQKEQQQQQQKSMYSPNVGGGSGGSTIQMSPAEFENIIDEILDGMGAGGARIAPAAGALNQGDVQAMMQQQELNRKIDEMEKTLIEMAERQKQNDLTKIARIEDINTLQKDLTEFSSRLLMEVQKVSDKVDDNQNSIRNIQNSGRNMNNSNGQMNNNNNGGNNGNGQMNNNNGGNNGNDQMNNNNNGGNNGDTGYNNTNKTLDELNVKTTGDFVEARDSSFADRISYQGMSSFAGFNVGGQTTFNVGFRWYYAIENSKFELMPETFFGFGSPASFGIGLNGVLPINVKNSMVKPYVSAGAGFMQIADDGEDKLKFTYNFIFGSYLNFAGGRVFADFTARNAFKYNQIVVGYRLPF